MRGMSKEKQTHILSKQRKKLYFQVSFAEKQPNCVGQGLKTEIDCELEWSFFSGSEKNVFYFGILHAELNNVY